MKHNKNPHSWSLMAERDSSSPLCRIDPRVKLALSSAFSLAVALPLPQAAVALGIYLAVLGGFRLWPRVWAQFWRLKWTLLFLFLIDWMLISPEFAVAITFRILFLAGAFFLFTAGTTSEELRLALEWFRFPYRYAFSLSLAFLSLGFLDEEWQAIQEAQQSRGAWIPPAGLKAWLTQPQELIALVVPVVVMATRRAWALTEAAYARGFDSPHRRPYRKLQLRTWDWGVLALILSIGGALVIWSM